MQQKNLVIILIIIVVIALLALGAYIGFPDLFRGLIKPASEVKKEQPRIIENEQLMIPETKEISITESRGAIEKGKVEVPLVPKSEGEKVIVPKAVLTLRGSYDLAAIEVSKWATDAKLVFVKSLGAITLDGKSSQWQLAFSAKSKSKKGYEIIIQADQIVSQKEIDSMAVGADLPKSWMDSGEAISTLQELPQYSSVSVSAINFFYNVDAKEWRYGLNTSIGVASVRLH